MLDWDLDLTMEVGLQLVQHLNTGLLILLVLEVRLIFILGDIILGVAIITAILFYQLQPGDLTILESTSLRLIS